MLYTSNKITAAAIREVQYPTTKNAEFEAGITLADGMGMETGVLRARSERARVTSVV